MILVASFTDAWIETSTGKNHETTRQSHLLQMRGLKLLMIFETLMLIRSHLLQMRGLKPLFKGAFERVFNVASFTGTTFIIFFARRLQD